MTNFNEIRNSLIESAKYWAEARNSLRNNDNYLVFKCFNDALNEHSYFLGQGYSQRLINKFFHQPYGNLCRNFTF